MLDFTFRGMSIGQFFIWFFIYSFLGWAMECVVIRIQLGRWENRGFARLPFCVIYGVGTFIAFNIFKPIEHNYIALFILGSICATAFEYVTAQVMLKLFGKVWWNYDHRPFNYKGILCLESTIAWGVLCITIFGVVNYFVQGAVLLINEKIALYLGFGLVCAYLLDFGTNFINRLNLPGIDESNTQSLLARIRRR